MAADEAGLNLGAQRRLVGLDCEQMVGAGVPDGGCDGRVGSNGVDRDDGAAKPVVLGEPGQQHRDGGQFAGLVDDGFLAEHQVAGGGEGRDEVDGDGAGREIVAAARGLAIDGDEVRPVKPARAYPGGENRREQGRNAYSRASCL